MPPAWWRSPRIRARLLAVFLAANLVIVLLPAADANRLGLVDPAAAWISQFEADAEGTPANTYSIALWSAVAVLGLAQLLRPVPPGRRRWLWVLGWLSVASLGALIGLEEGADLKDLIGDSPEGVAAAIDEVAGGARWLALSAPLLAVPVAAAGWVIGTAQRGHPVRQLLTGLVALLLISAVF